MAEYIEREAAMNAVAEAMFKYIPAADVAEVKHGKWIVTNLGNDWADAECSCCGEERSFSEYHDFYKYCPNCGAKMHEGVKNDKGF